MIYYGIYKFSPRTIAYRNDFCLNCAAPRRAYCIKSFYWAYLFFIPLLPLGFWKVWRCSTCKRDPHIYPGTGNSLRPLALSALALFGAVAWLAPDPDAYTWGARILLTLGFCAALWYTGLDRPPAGMRDLLKQVQPASEVECGVCGGAVVVADRSRCSQCDAERVVVG